MQKARRCVAAVPGCASHGDLWQHSEPSRAGPRRARWWARSRGTAPADVAWRRRHVMRPPLTPPQRWRIDGGRPENGPHGGLAMDQLRPPVVPYADRASLGPSAASNDTASDEREDELPEHERD